MSDDGPRVVLQAPVDDDLRWLSLTAPVKILRARSLDEVHSVLRAAEKEAAAGRIAAGFVSYEAAPAFDSALAVHPPGRLPLAWFGVFEDPEILSALPRGELPVPDLSWQPSMTAEEYVGGIDTVRGHIASGDTYQVNFTLRLTATLVGDPWDLFTGICSGQASRCCAYVDTGHQVLCSASPELFFRLAGERIWSRPMKGTAPRGRTLPEDRELAQWLRGSAKNRAENVMIVDMVRNDLGRVALPGTVRVADLWHLEKYPSLFQLTSTVEARTEATLNEIFNALFPCASVTGAPKVRSMEIIRELEQGPRGAYTGAIGLIGPGRRARFNVAIRTVEFDPESRTALYGTGSGVVWESEAREEWRECQTKTLVLEPAPGDFDLLETLLWEPERGFHLVEQHLARLRDSATYFEFPYEEGKIRAALSRSVRGLPRRPHRTRLLLTRTGATRVEHTPFESDSDIWHLALATEPVASSDPFLFHKTTHRQVYNRFRDRHPQHDDVLLWNENREITESTLANVVIRSPRGLVTPPLDCGLLAGTYRAQLLEKGEIKEEVIRLADLVQVEEIHLVNSVRGWIRVALDRTTLASIAETHASRTA